MSPDAEDLGIDRFRLARGCLLAVAILQLLSLNMVGLAGLWNCLAITSRTRLTWLFGIGLLLFQLALSAIILGARLGGLIETSPGPYPLEWLLALQFVSLGPCAAGLYALLSPGTWRRIGMRTIHLCANCGYDLRHTHARCPECGEGIPAEVRRALEREFPAMRVAISPDDWRAGTDPPQPRVAAPDERQVIDSNPPPPPVPATRRDPYGL